MNDIHANEATHHAGGRDTRVDGDTQAGRDTRTRPHDTHEDRSSTTTRRGFLAATAVGTLVVGGTTALTAGTAAGQQFSTGASVRLKSIATGLSSPVAFVVADDGRDRAFVVNQDGTVSIVDPDEGGVTGTFIDVGDRIVSGGEKGLLGMAFHPNFASNQRFYLHYSAPSRSGTQSDFDHTEVFAAFEASADGNRGRPGTEQTLLEIPHPQGNHNAGAIAFGPDGYLYMGMGDGGGGSGDVGTGHVEDWYDKNDGGNGQDIESNLLGSILRLDVDGSGSYSIPEDNPLADRRDLEKRLRTQYAWGFRNPFKLSLDSRGRLFVGDVGQSAYEEIDLVEAGGNYGWNVREGRHCYGANSCPEQVTSGPRDGEPLEAPIVEYPHSVGRSVTGGYVYEEDTVGALAGKYVFGDFTASALFAATEANDGSWQTEKLVVAGTDDGSVPGSVRGFGRDASGELYVVTGSDILKIVPDIEARDPDGDDRYEDVDGKNGVDVVDVQRLFARRNDDAIQGNPGAFDFTGDGEVNVVDVQRLFARFVR